MKRTLVSGATLLAFCFVCTGVFAQGWLAEGEHNFAQLRNKQNSAENQSMNQTQKCKLVGSARVRISQHTLRIPRNILQSVTLPNGQYDFSWKCEDTLVDARSIYMRVSKGAGADFYADWINQKKLPIEIELVRRGDIVRFTEDFLANAKQRGAATSSDALGFEVTDTKPATLFDASPLGLVAHGNRKIVFSCAKYALGKSGHHCRVSYPYNDAFDVVYGFMDSQFPQRDWAALDGRLRTFLNGLIE